MRFETHYNSLVLGTCVVQRLLQPMDQVGLLLQSHSKTLVRLDSLAPAPWTLAYHQSH